MRIKIKKSLAFLILAIALFMIFSYIVFAPCTGTNTYTVKIYSPSRALVKNSSLQTIDPIDGTACNSASNPSTTIVWNCQESGTYVANVTLLSGTDHANVADTNVLTCYAPETRKFMIKNESSNVIAAFDEKGYMYLRGINVSNQGALSPTQNSYIIKNNTGTVVAYINSSGNLFLRGSLSVNRSAINPPLNSFIIRNSTSRNVAYIDSTGNLVLSGQLYFNWTAAI